MDLKKQRLRASGVEAAIAWPHGGRGGDQARFATLMRSKCCYLVFPHEGAIQAVSHVIPAAGSC